MVVNSLKAMLFIAGGTVVAAGAAYVTGALDVFLPEKPQVAVSQPPESETEAPPAAAVQPDPSAAPAEQLAALPSADEPAAATTEKAGRLIVPSFDLLRVEPDGSVVVAGQAAPLAKVEVVTGSNVIGSTTAGSGGDFAVVLGEPLKPGDYTLVLRSTTPDNVVATSEETAVVSVPETRSGQVLALVEKPGSPSKLITLPQAAADKQDRPAAPAAEAESAEAAPSQETEPAPQAAAEAGMPAPDGGREGEAALAADAPPAAQPAQEQQAAAGDDPAPAAAADVPAQASHDAGQASGEPAAAPPAATQTAAAQPEAATLPVPAADKPRVSVEAVEIEGSRVFVAGRTEANGRVRVYANEILLGDATASPDGQFLVEAQRELPVGDYIVRADLLGPRAEVLARAAVPFEREPGESIAAVAAPQQPAQAPATSPKPAQHAAEAEAQAAGAAADPAPAPAPQDAAAAPAAPAGSDTPDTPAAQEERRVAAAEADPSAVPRDDAADAGAAIGVTAPKLQSVAGAVIIRRGDTLWRISRRVYGRGVRYTTIYLANQDQIADPDRIWPGQVFSVPNKTGDGEQADMSAVADRVVPVE